MRVLDSRKVYFRFNKAIVLLLALGQAVVVLLGARLEALLVVLVALLLAHGGLVIAVFDALIGGDGGDGESEDGKEFHVFDF